MSKLFGSKDGDAQGENKSDVPEKEQSGKTVQETDAEASKNEVERQPQPRDAENSSKTGVEVGDQVFFFIDDTDPKNGSGQRKLLAFVTDVLEDDKVHLAVFNTFGANFGQVSIEHSDKPRVGRWSWPEDKADEVLPNKPVPKDDDKK